jgi:hypothetical protein
MGLIGPEGPETASWRPSACACFTSAFCSYKKIAFSFNCTISLRWQGYCFRVKASSLTDGRFPGGPRKSPL